MSDTINRTLSRGLLMLELLGEHPDGLALNQLARLLDLPKSTAFNLVRTLLARKYVRYQPETARYQMGLRMFEVGSAAVNNLDISGVIRQCMSEVNREVNETVHCGLLSGREILYIDKQESTRSIRMASHVGLSMPLYCTAMGKAVLSQMTDGQVRALYERETFASYARNTVRDLPALLGQLSRFRAMGYAVEMEENNDNVCCVGVAVRDRDDRPAYALSISVPIFRFTPEGERRYAELLLRAERKIERFLTTL